ncbi:MAG TPA: hypothetical protein PKC30_04270 [Saprospiraceae bacterium]|nr:hypothetical protein [Saprospiraceae bacterium]
MNQNNTIAMGLLFGAVTPILGYIAIDFLFSVLESMGLMAEATASVMIKRERTTTLLALCCNLLPFQYAKKRRFDKIIVGILLTTFVYAGAWLYRYFDMLL